MEVKIKLVSGLLIFSRPCSGVIRIKINDIDATLTDEELMEALVKLSIKGLTYEIN